MAWIVAHAYRCVLPIVPQCLWQLQVSWPCAMDKSFQDPIVVDPQWHQNWRNSVEILRGKGLTQWYCRMAEWLFFVALRMWVAAANGCTRPMIQCGTDFRRTCGRKAGIVICREPSQAHKSYDSLEMKNSPYGFTMFQHVPPLSALHRYLTCGNSGMVQMLEAQHCQVDLPSFANSIP